VCRHHPKRAAVGAEPLPYRLCQLLIRNAPRELRKIWSMQARDARDIRDELALQPFTVTGDAPEEPGLP
jgi:hypothetical protein